MADHVNILGEFHSSEYAPVDEHTSNRIRVLFGSSDEQGAVVLRLDGEKISPRSLNYQNERVQEQLEHEINIFKEKVTSGEEFEKVLKKLHGPYPVKDGDKALQDFKDQLEKYDILKNIKTFSGEKYITSQLLDTVDAIMPTLTACTELQFEKIHNTDNAGILGKKLHMGDNGKSEPKARHPYTIMVDELVNTLKSLGRGRK